MYLTTKVLKLSLYAVELLIKLVQNVVPKGGILVVLKLAEALDIHILLDDIEVSHKLNTRNKSIIVKFLNHKVKTKQYKSRTKLKHIKAADLFPSRNYSSVAGREPRIFINENLTDHRRHIISKANKMRKDQLIQSQDITRRIAGKNFFA